MAVEFSRRAKHIEAQYNFDIPPFVVDFNHMLKTIKNIETVESVYLSTSKFTKKLEIYVFYQTENLDIEEKIMAIFTNWEEDYQYFPEIYIYPMDKIDDKHFCLPSGASEY